MSRESLPSDVECVKRVNKYNFNVGGFIKFTSLPATPPHRPPLVTNGRSSSADVGVAVTS